METVGDRITRLMKRAGLKNPDVAAALHVDATTVSKWRSGNQVPADAKLLAFVELLRTRGVHTSLPELNGGDEASRSQERTHHQMYGVGEVEFESLPAKQRARVWLEGFLLELVEYGAPEAFVTSARRFLLNPANYEHGFREDGMGDEQKLQHMQALSIGLRATLKEQAPPPATSLRSRHQKKRRA